jgi:hypothetical protein
MCFPCIAKKGLCIAVCDNCLLTSYFLCVSLECCVCCVCNLLYASEHFIYEPLTAGTLETMAIGVETSYKCVMALKVRLAYTLLHTVHFITFLRQQRRCAAVALAVL